MPAARPRIVIVYAMAGVGHRRAAEALASACQARSRVECHLVDILDFMPAWFRWLYPRLYLFCVQRAPFIWAVLYAITNQDGVEWLQGLGRRYLNYWLGQPFVAWVKATGARTVISTHFLPAEIMSVAKARRRVAVPLWTVITDYEPHRFWIAPRTDRYFVGASESRYLLQRLGVTRTPITVSGIPTDPAFAKRRDHALLIKRYRFEVSRTTLLITSGGAGMGCIEGMVRALLQATPALHARIQVVVVAGTNLRLKQRLTRIVKGSAFPIHILGYTTAMPELVALADVVVTKPGGLTVTEALAAGKPLALFSPIWGQETGNARTLIGLGVARMLQHPEAIVPLITRWVRQPQLFSEVRALSRSALPRHAAHTIIEAVA